MSRSGATHERVDPDFIDSVRGGVAKMELARQRKKRPSRRDSAGFAIYSTRRMSEPCGCVGLRSF